MKTRLLALLLALLAAGTLGCGDSHDFQEVSGQQGNPANNNNNNNQVAFVRVAHLSPDAGNVDVVINGVQQITDVSFETVSNYLTLPAGSTRVEIRPTGTTTDAIDQTVTLLADTYYTAAATGSVTGNDALGLLLLTDDVTPTPNTVSVRFLNAAAGSGALTLTDDQGNVIAGPETFNSASAYLPFTQVIATDSVQLRDANGTVVAVYQTVRGGNETIFDALAGALDANGANVTVIATGGEGQSGILAIDRAGAGGETFISDPAAAN
jgi:hypothetical protein